jgi:hypothetical protein
MVRSTSVFFELPQDMTMEDANQLVYLIDLRFPSVRQGYTMFAETIHERAHEAEDELSGDQPAMRMSLGTEQGSWGFSTSRWYRSPEGQRHYPSVEIQHSELFSYNDS